MVLYPIHVPRVAVSGGVGQMRRVGGGHSIEVIAAKHCRIVERGLSFVSWHWLLAGHIAAKCVCRMNGII